MIKLIIDVCKFYRIMLKKWGKCICKSNIKMFLMGSWLKLEKFFMLLGKGILISRR